jgi:hypothetical protein
MEGASPRLTPGTDKCYVEGGAPAAVRFQADLEGESVMIDFAGFRG